VAAKSGAAECVKILIDGLTFTEELLKKDYLGNTPLHYAARKGNLAIFEFFINEGGEPTKLMLDLQNDFGLTVREAVLEKIRNFEDIIHRTEGQRTFVKSLEEYIVRLQSVLRCIERLKAVPPPLQPKE
jgi:ankyrin repeat protein